MVNGFGVSGKPVDGFFDGKTSQSVEYPTNPLD